MIVILRSALFVFVCLLAALGPVRADEAQDRRVEQGVALYDDGAYAQAKTILLPLAEAGHPKAMHFIGRMNKFGQGFSAYPAIGCDWYERAANAGYANSMYNMSICYDGFGRPDDPDMDKQWLLKAAEHGVTDAMINLSALDLTEGEEYRYWMNQAVQHGSVYAQVSLWLQGYKNDVPDIKVQDIVCVSVLVLILDRDFGACD